MKKILLSSFLFLSLVLCLVSSGWGGGLDDFKAGLSAQNRGDYDEAIRLYTKAIAAGDLSQKDLLSVYNNRGIVWQDKGDYDRAMADYTKAIELNPRYASAYGNRGYAWKNKGDYDRAIADYTKVIELDPRDARADNALAWLLAVCPESKFRDGVKAVKLAQKAVELESSNPNYLGTLAAAYAEAGRFQDAIKAQEGTIAKLKEKGDVKSLARFEERLASYKAGKPWRER